MAATAAPGGSVYLLASDHINTLVNFRFHPEHHADDGKPGSGSNRTGSTGNDLVLEVPIGTLVYAQEIDPEGEPADGEASAPTSEREWTLFADLAEPGQRVLVARGGKGGLGNAFYATSTNRAPRKSQPGLPGEARRLRLHLKLLADVGLVGYPNAGKSTLISRISAAKPKIADYPFTTLTPNLGVVLMRDDRSFVVADVPGLIEGAHTGHGLGDRFLKHLERTKVLIVLVDVSGMSGRAPADDLDVLRKELALFDAELGKQAAAGGGQQDGRRHRRVAGRVARSARARTRAALLPHLGRRRDRPAAAARSRLDHPGRGARGAESRARSQLDRIRVIPSESE